jgi:hypothetical protein
VAGATAGQRISVGLFGDSVTEGLVIQNFQTQGLAAQLTTAETKYGFSRGGQGLIAANQYQWKFNRFGLLGFGPIPPTGWALIGDQGASHVQPGVDGPSGYSAVTSSPVATASTTVHNPDVEVMYTSTLVPCTFAVTSGTRSWTINTFTPGILFPEPEESLITVGLGTHSVTVHGSDCGGLSLNGVVAEQPVRAGSTQIMFDNNGHSGRLPSTDLSSRVEESILDQHYKVSVFLWGYIGELELSKGPTADAYEQALLTRTKLARMNGGACLIVEPTPMPVTNRQVKLVAGIERSVAQQAGCTYTPALAHEWKSPDQAINRGLVVLDGIHPTAKGYTLIAATLAPIIAQLAR